MIRIGIPALVLLTAFAPLALAKQPKPGIYATSQTGCAALAKQDPRRELKSGDVLDGQVTGAAASFLVVEEKRLGSVDFECTIGKPRKKAKRTEWPLACAGESSGGPSSTVRLSSTGTLVFRGGLKDWGEVHFCR